MEAIFTRVEGILHVESGYMGGAKAPTYKEVSSGTTGHAEVRLGICFILQSFSTVTARL